MKPLREILILAILMFGVCSCIEVKFKESQPTGIEPLAEIPAYLQGKYRNEHGDTLFLSAKKFSLFNRESECNKMSEHDSISDRVQIKKWNEYLFFNMNEDSLWTVGIIREIEGSGFEFLLIDAEDPEVLTRISSITKMVTYVCEDDEPLVYVVNPSGAELEKMITEKSFSISYNFQRLP